MVHLNLIFKSKANYFNKFFADQCTPFVNKSKLDKITDNSAARVTSIKFGRSLNVNKTHGHDGISVKTIKMCNESQV